ncbi:MAG: Maf family nucleotide pyrophosphatase [Candidatus Thiodiazotropha sp.]
MPNPSAATHPPLVLASSSPYRRELLSRLGVEFSTTSPDIDETRKEQEHADELVVRLAVEKAKAVAESHPDALIIGSDQVATLQGRILGKPGNHERAVEQLKSASGHRVTFSTGLCVYNSRTGELQSRCEHFHVHFRNLQAYEIEHYLRKEQPYQCAGSFKSEGLGICLFERLEGDDPNTLIGLPLIRLIEMLRCEGLDILAV